MFRKLLSFDEAKQILKQTFSSKPLGTEQISISNAHNRVLAEDIVAPTNIPPFN
ncbi:MAG TPA: molybdopterin molybdenumtransferase MoeA, partial [Candidatus Bathyarchaeota archaeon]|nr:molybdopterin molybdenumtransferase MoeA [Candidatus Bathyarchaeota archaeon]